MSQQAKQNLNNNNAVEEIKNRLDIVDVVSEQVVLKKSGRNYWGLCPFHKEKTPSFSVNAEKNIYKCFGCGEGGDSLSFLMKTKNQNFWETIVELAQKFGIELPSQGVSSEKTEIKNQILEVNKQAVKFFNNQLLESIDAQKAREYLKNRNITPETINDFKIGFAPDSFDSLINYLTKKGYKPDLLNKAGLVSEKSSGNGYYDRFRNRIIIPIQNEKGEYIAFGARALDSSQNPKYLNSPETPVFNKSRSMFAIHQAKDYIKKEDSVILMEGFFDVIAAHTHGLKNVVATLGTALTEQHIKILARYTDSRKIYLAFDSDDAGLNATTRGAEIIKSAFTGLGDIKQFDESFAGNNDRTICEIRVVTTTSGKDPDDFIRSEGIEAYKNLLNHAPLLIDYQINTIIKSKDRLTSPQDKAKLVKELIPILSDIQNSIIRNEYTKLVSESLQIDEESLVIEIKKTLQKVTSAKKKINIKAAKNIEDKHILAQKNLLSLYFVNNENFTPLCINKYLREVKFTDKNIGVIKNQIDQLVNEVNNPEKLSEELFSRLIENEEAKSLLVDVIYSTDDKQDLDAKTFEQFIKDHIAFLDRYNYSIEQNQLRSEYRASAKEDGFSVEHQKRVLELIVQNKSYQ